MNPERKIKTSAGEETATQTADRINSIRAEADSPEPQVSEEGQAAAGRIAAARADNTITPESLAPQAEVQVTDPQTGTAMAGLGGALEAQTDSFAQGLTDTRKQREAEKNQSRTNYSSLVANRTGLEGFSLQADQDAGVFEAESALQDINNEMRAEQLARRRSNELITSTGGQSKGQAQSQINNVNRESYAKQADMAIEQLAAQGRFNSAIALADRKANAMFEQEQNQIDAAKITYEDNKDLYNNAEKREFETALTDRTNRVQAEKEQMQAVQKLAIDALNGGAPQSLVSEMMKSKTLADASALGGQFVGALDREQQRASIRSNNASAGASNALRLQREAETDLLLNPSLEETDAATVELVQGLDKGTREQIVNARDTSSELNAMKSILESVDNNLELLTPATEEGREFRRISENVADKLARERTGAVVSEEEQASFRKIMGLGVFNVLSKDDEEIIGALDKILSPHSETLRLADPTGEIQTFLDAGTLDTETADEVDVIFGLPAEVTDLNASKYF